MYREVIKENRDAATDGKNLCEQNGLQSSSSDLSYTDSLLGQLKTPAKLHRISVKRSFISMVWPAIHTNPSIKKELFENALITRRIRKRWHCV